MSVVTDVATYLANESIVDGATGWTSVRGFLHDGTDRLVAIKADGGLPPEVGRSSGMGDAASKGQRVHFTVRGQPNERDDTEDKANEIRDALHGLQDITLGSTRYESVDADSEVIEVKQDDNARRLFTIALTFTSPQGAPA